MRATRTSFQEGGPATLRSIPVDDGDRAAFEKHLPEFQKVPHGVAEEESARR